MNNLSQKLKQLSQRIIPSITKTGLPEIPLFVYDRDITRYLRLVMWAFRCIPFSKSLFQLLKQLTILRKDNGLVFLTQYLKEALRLTMTAIAKNPGRSSPGGVFVRVAKDGLPRIIPSILREEIRKNNVPVIRCVLTILSVFRLLVIPGKLKLSTITDDFSGLTETLPQSEVSSLWKERFMHWSSPLDEVKYLISSKKGPNRSLVAWLSSFLDARAWSENPELFDSLRTLCAYTPGGPTLLAYLENTISFMSTMESLPYTIFRDKENSILKLGKLAEKQEAAGKVRVFAITDYWTQLVLYPLHKAIFRILKKIPQDGTFNQAKPLALLNELLRGSVKTFSFDLSAATDRLPVALQEQILALWLGQEYASSWRKVLTGRDWVFTETTKRIINDRRTGFRNVEIEVREEKSIRYAVGQPMGAYSSWAMLALTHHFIVQLASRRVGIVGWFPHYAILGDDVVIANEAVANAYLVLMKDLGVGINMSKSLVSTGGTFEFAKRLVSPTVEYTPLGPKNIWMALNNIKMLPIIFIDLLGKGEPLSWDSISSMLKSLPRGLYPKGIVNENFLQLMEQAMQMPGGYLFNFRNMIKGNYPSKWSLQLRDGPQSVRTKSLVKAITKVVVTSGMTYVDTIKSLPISLSEAIIWGTLVYDQVHNPITEKMCTELTELFNKSIVGQAYTAERQRLLDSERVHRFLKRYDPTDKTTLRYLEDLCDSNSLAWRRMPPDELYVRLGDLINLNVNETIRLEHDTEDQLVLGTFAAHASKIKKLYKLHYAYYTRVNRELLPVIYQGK